MLLIGAYLAATSFAAKHSRLKKIPQEITVRVVGGLCKEQLLTLPMGSKVADALAFVEVSEGIDFGKLSLEETLKPDQILIIPTTGKISVYITGAVKRPGLYLFPSICTYKELVSSLSFEENADTTSLKRRRRALREGEMIHVPTKESENDCRK